jgi:hypothetical protein
MQVQHVQNTVEDTSRVPQLPAPAVRNRQPVLKRYRALKHHQNVGSIRLSVLQFKKMTGNNMAIFLPNFMSKNRNYLLDLPSRCYARLVYPFVCIIKFQKHSPD